MTSSGSSVSGDPILKPCLEYVIFHDDKETVIHLTERDTTVGIRLSRAKSISLAKAFQSILEWEKEND